MLNGARDTHSNVVRTAVYMDALDIDIDIVGFINYLMYGIQGSYLSPPPPQSSFSRSGAGVGIAFRVRLP
eukprot:COSAG02_NODE_347_length_24085_cov_23.240724_4_plen_70_part_00